MTGAVRLNAQRRANPLTYAVPSSPASLHGTRGPRVWTQSWCPGAGRRKSSSAGGRWGRAGWRWAAPGEEHPRWLLKSALALPFCLSSPTFSQSPHPAKPRRPSLCPLLREGSSVGLASPLRIAGALVGAGAVGNGADPRFPFPPFTPGQRGRIRLAGGETSRGRVPGGTHWCGWLYDARLFWAQSRLQPWGGFTPFS